MDESCLRSCVNRAGIVQVSDESVGPQNLLSVCACGIIEIGAAPQADISRYLVSLEEHIGGVPRILPDKTAIQLILPPWVGESFTSNSLCSQGGGIFVSGRILLLATSCFRPGHPFGIHLDPSRFSAPAGRPSAHHPRPRSPIRHPRSRIRPRDER